MGRHGYYYAMGSSSGQHYVDLGYDPAEDSSWFHQTTREHRGRYLLPYARLQLGGCAIGILMDMMLHDVMEVECGRQP